MEKSTILKEAILMKEFWENLRLTCVSAKLFLVLRTFAIVAASYMAVHFWTVGGVWGTIAMIHCLITVISAVRGYIKMLVFHKDDFYLEREFDIY